MSFRSTSPATAATPTPPTGRRVASRGLVLGIILTVQLMVVLDMTIVNVALPDIQRALGFTPAGLSWVLSAYTLTFGGLMLLGARAGDLLGRRRTFLAGIGVFTAASLVGGLSTSPGVLLAARAAQGVGGALAAPSALAILMIMFAEGRERTRALGLFAAVSIGGSAVGLLAGGMLTAWASWRWVFFVNVPIGIALVLLARAALPETPRRSGGLDIAGALTSTIGMAAVVDGFVRAATDGWTDRWTLGSFVLGVSLLTSFVLVELRAKSPITPLALFADRSRATSYLARLLLVAGMMGMFFFLTLFLQDVLGYSPIRTGLAFLPLTVALFAASQLSARVLVERFGGRALMIGGISLSTLAELWLTQLSGTSGYLSVLGPLVVFGIGNGLAFVPLTAASLVGVAPADAGAASGLVNVMQQVGGSLGLAVLVTVFGTAERNAARHPVAGLSPAEQAQHLFVIGADRAFAVAALFLAVTVALVVIGIRSGRPPAPAPARQRVTQGRTPALAEAD